MATARRFNDGDRVVIRTNGASGSVDCWFGPYQPLHYRIKLDKEELGYGSLRNAHVDELIVEAKEDEVKYKQTLQTN